MGIFCKMTRIRKRSIKGILSLSGRALVTFPLLRSLRKNCSGFSARDQRRTAQVTTAMIRIGISVVSTKASPFQTVT